MGALTIAFDITLVGALALPWVYLAIHLFIFEGENYLQEAMDWISDQGAQAVAGVLLFAMAFTLGSAISRVAQDFFNDDDLRIPWMLRMTMTEDRIVASVYCEADETLVLHPSQATPTLTKKLETYEHEKANCCKPGEPPQSGGVKPSNEKEGIRAHKSRTCTGAEQTPCLCQMIVNGVRRSAYDKQHKEEEEDLLTTTRDIFGLEENALLLRGEDATLRLRQLHDQIMVLRGATFNGLIAFSLCLFGWAASARMDKARQRLGWVLTLTPAVFLLLAADALYHHLKERQVGQPPYMEFSLFVIWAAGAWLLWRKLPLFDSADPEAEDSSDEDQICLRRWKWGLMSLVFAVLFVAGVLGWWSTEVLYGQQVIYSYDAQPPEAKANQ